MATQVGNVHGFAATSVGVGPGNRTNLNGGNVNSDTGLFMPGYTMSSVDTSLISIDAGFYTARRLETMTFNDKIYAVRVAQYASSIKQ